MGKHFLRQILIYGGGSLLRSALSLALLTVYVRFLTANEFGNWVLLELTILVLSPFLLLGLDIGLIKEHAFLATAEQRETLARTVLLFVVGWVSAGSAVLISTRHLWASWIIEDPAAPLYAAYAVLIAGCEALIQIRLSILRAQQRAFAFSLLTTLQLATTLLLTFVFVVVWQKDIAGALLGRLLASLAILLSCSVIVPVPRFRSFSPEFLKRSLRYGLPLLPTNLSIYILLASDRYFLKYFSTLEQVAVYSFAYKVAALLEILVTRPFATAWVSIRFDMAHQEHADRAYGQVIVYFLFATTLVGTVLLVFSREIFALLALPMYVRGLGVLPLLVLSYIVFGVAHPVNVGIMLRDKTSYLAVITGGAAGLNLLLNWVLIPRWGMYGAGIATLVSYILWTALLGYLSQKLYPVVYDWKRMAIPALIGTGVVILTWFVSFPNAWLSVGVKGVVAVGSFLFGLYAFSFFRESELTSTRELLRTSVVQWKRWIGGL